MMSERRVPMLRWPLWDCLVPLDDAEHELRKGSIYVFMQVSLKDWSVHVAVCGRVTAFDGAAGRGVYYEALDTCGGECFIPYDEYIQDGYEWQVVPAEFCYC